MSNDPQTPDTGASDTEHENDSEHVATDEGMPQSPEEVDDGSAE